MSSTSSAQFDGPAPRGSERLSTCARDYFQINAPAALFQPLSSVIPGARLARRRVVLGLRAQDDARGLHVIDGEPTPLIAFPTGLQKLVEILQSRPAGKADGQDLVTIAIPRDVFDKLADDLGVARIAKLNLSVGAAAPEDELVGHLGACLDHAVRQDAQTTVNRISEALTLHIAQRYGGLQSTPPRTGGLAPWQLRLAQKTLDKNLDGPVGLEDLARSCGLSTSHFSRAFTRSTGFAPHRWLTRRRVQIAGDMIASDSMPLAQIALACGFFDQSHFTRAFVNVMGLTPGRWRASQNPPLARSADGPVSSDRPPAKSRIGALSKAFGQPLS